ncbi:MAG: 3-oxoacyl-ACP reductase [Paenacidovorax caeni]
MGAGHRRCAGLGQAITRALAREGAGVVINYHRSAAAAQALAEELGPRAIALQADVTDAAAVQRLFAVAQERTGGHISAVVNNALAQFSFDGDARPKLGDIAWERFSQQIEGAVRARSTPCRRRCLACARRGLGASSTWAPTCFKTPWCPTTTTAAKAALLSLTRTAANDLGPDGITVNMVSGGLLRTTDASSATPEAVFDLIASMTPLRRVTTPAEFADAVLFFLSPWARAVTGQNLVVDSGLVKD